MVLGLAMAVAVAASPRMAPAAFVSEQYGLTFRTPPGASYCALPEDWVGSDHGTVIFLTPPKQCGGAGYPSSSRSFEGNSPRIEVFYAYDAGDDEADQKPARCKEVGRVVLLGNSHQLCWQPSRQGVQVSISAKYPADVPAQATLTLVTSRRRLKDDLFQFKRLIKSAGTCTATWHDDKGGKPFTTGSGPPCPRDARWF
jgi:hypothetical protein